MALSRRRPGCVALGKQKQAPCVFSCRNDRCRPKGTGNLLKLRDMLCNGLDIPGSEPDLDGSRKQSRLNDRLRFDVAECPLDRVVGTLCVPLRQPKQRPARLWLTA
jgi:hypothetical protein